MAFEDKKTDIQKLYAQYAGAVAYVTVEDDEQNEGIGSAFHIGDGIFVTAKHVIDNKKILEVATTKRIELTQETIDEEKEPEIIIIEPKVHNIIEGPFVNENEDISVFKVDLENDFFPSVQLGSHTSHEITDSQFVLANVLVIGYPPIPFTNTPNQVVASGQVNAVIDVRHSDYVHFVLSTMARGGFSGGVVLSESGFALGLVTESLGTGESLVETGYMSILSIDSAIELAVKHFDFNLQKYGIYRDQDSLIEVKMVNESLGRLNSRLFNACVYVYDDDRDVFMEFICDDQELLHPAYEIFNSVTPIHIDESMSKDNLLFTQPSDNPPATLLVTAAEAVRDFFMKSDYHELSTKRNSWQIRDKA
ncbi:S1 family peptidase [Shewanella violacea]|uniref:Serine protease n=1 Tax=Shewanella violacea (strain JCM 10179 / CIP 106290 / LMG 19151 / DSS12) TaxID=637905 RepID=D4ZHM0_SHEVD|nr:serine protease [Shewanella violacea]BAJ01169.1 hypothetical protein SVI_1198 [Shewanella violacea DSS12]